MVIDEVSLGILSNYNKVTRRNHNLTFLSHKHKCGVHGLYITDCISRTVSEGDGALSDLSSQTVFCTRSETEDGCLYVRLGRTRITLDVVSCNALCSCPEFRCQIHMTARVGTCFGATCSYFRCAWIVTHIIHGIIVMHKYYQTDKYNEYVRP